MTATTIRRGVTMAFALAGTTASTTETLRSLPGFRAKPVAMVSRRGFKPSRPVALSALATRKAPHRQARSRTRINDDGTGVGGGVRRK